MKHVIIGSVDGQGVALDIPKLIDTRLLVQANSGGGKSWLIRRLLEQSHGKVQQIVIDLEGEFSTLREKYDYVVAGKDAEVKADTKSAGLLARRLLELGVSAIIDLYELPHQDRKRFVRLFLEAMINAPKELWHPVLIVIDEAHVFCPEKGEAESAEAVKDLMTRGRKRGFCGVLATQRLSKLHKDAAAECNNKLIGRTGIDIDMKRASDELGFTTKEQFYALRKLESGQFFAYGPAISQEIVSIRVGDVETSHPIAGHRADFKAASPTSKIRAILSELGDLQQEAKAEADTITALKHQVYELTNELRKSQVHKCEGITEEQQRANIDKVTVEVERILGQKHHQEITTAIKLFGRLSEMALQAADEVSAAHTKPFKVVHGFLSKTTPFEIPKQSPVPAPAWNVETVKPPKQIVVDRDHSANVERKLTGGASRMVGVLVGRYPKEVTLKQLATLSAMSPTSGTFSTYLGAIRSAGMVEESSKGVFRASQKALEAAGDIEPLSREQLIGMWRKTLSGGALRMFDHLLGIYPGSTDLESLARTCGMERSSGTFSTYLGKLRGNELVKMIDRQTIQISDELGQD